MERLTYREMPIAYADTPIQGYKDWPAVPVSASVRFEEIVDRLASYEDSGLAPEEINRIQETLVTAQRLKKEQYDTLEKYLKAEAEGRLVILPCKVGSEVFVLWFGSVVPATAISFHFYEWRDGYSVRVLCDTQKISGARDFSFEAFGKTLFFTREEAEAALKGETNG